MNRLKDLRKNSKLSQVQVQLMTGIDQSDYSKLETGKRNFTYDQLVSLSILFDTSMDYLAGLTDIKTPYPRSTTIKK